PRRSGSVSLKLTGTPSGPRPDDGAGDDAVAGLRFPLAPPGINQLAPLGAALLAVRVSKNAPHARGLRCRQDCDLYGKAVTQLVPLLGRRCTGDNPRGNYAARPGEALQQGVPSLTSEGKQRLGLFIKW